MTADEQQIRQLVQDWMDASEAGDSDRVLAMVTDDVVFLSAGRAPMRKPEFAEQLRQQSSASGMVIDGHSDIQEVRVAGEWAFMWTQLRVTVTPPGGAAVTRNGHTLTVFRKEDGRWRLARDANMLAAAK
jgi:uncharacterized protein (TIGR02246 family)